MGPKEIYDFDTGVKSFPRTQSPTLPETPPRQYNDGGKKNLKCILVEHRRLTRAPWAYFDAPVLTPTGLSWPYTHLTNLV